VDIVLVVVGVVLTWVLAGQQWLRSRHDIAGISVTTWGAFAAVNSTWTLYGIVNTQWQLIISAGVAAAFNVALVVRLPHRVRTLAAIAAAVGAAGMLGVAVSWTAVVVAITVVSIGLRWPQIAVLVSGAPVTGVSLGAWVAGLVNSAAWAGIWIRAGEVALIASAVSITASTAVLVTLLLWRRHQARHATPSPAAG
jgi:hypothetical protein